MSKLETNTIDNISGSSTLNLGDTNATNITIDNGVTTLDFGTGISTVSNMPAAFKNTPAFEVRQTSGQSVNSASFTKITWNVENYDTNNAFASDKFTVPSGQDGKYYLQVTTELAGIDDAEFVQVLFYKNGSSQAGTTARWYAPGANDDVRARTNVILNLSAADYVEAYIYHNEGAALTLSTSETFFRGFKLIGV